MKWRFLDLADDNVNDPELDEYGSTWQPVKVRDYETDW